MKTRIALSLLFCGSLFAAGNGTAAAPQTTVTAPGNATCPNLSNSGVTTPSATPTIFKLFISEVDHVQFQRRHRLHPR